MDGWMDGGWGGGNELTRQSELTCGFRCLALSSMIVTHTILLIGGCESVGCTCSAAHRSRPGGRGEVVGVEPPAGEQAVRLELFALHPRLPLRQVAGAEGRPGKQHNHCDSVELHFHAENNRGRGQRVTRKSFDLLLLVPG